MGGSSAIHDEEPITWYIVHNFSDDNEIHNLIFKGQNPYSSVSTQPPHSSNSSIDITQCDLVERMYFQTKEVVVMIVKQHHID